MRPPRPPDWFIYVLVVAALTGAAIFSRSPGEKPPASPPMPENVGFAIGPASPFDPSVEVKTSPRGRAGRGTAFSVGGAGLWLTARHVVDGCARTAILIGPALAVEARVSIDPAGETAVLITRGGAPGLPLAPLQVLHRGGLGFHPGFPQGRPGQAETRLMGRQALILGGSERRREPVLAWAEVGGEPGLFDDLAGLSGAPVLDGQGRVLGVTIAQARGHRRLYTTTPTSLRAALARAGVTPTPPEPGKWMDRVSYGRVSDDLRRRLQVAPVVCLER